MFINKKSLNLRRTPFKHKVNNNFPVSEKAADPVSEANEVKNKISQSGKAKKNNVSEGQKD